MCASVSGVCAERAASVESGALVPRVSITIRPATMEDIPFIDGLQKAHRNMVGWMPRAQLEGYIQSGGVLIAEEGSSTRRATEGHGEGIGSEPEGKRITEGAEGEAARHQQLAGIRADAASPHSSSLHPSSIQASSCHTPATSSVSSASSVLKSPCGYIIARDRYFKRDDCGIIYQVNVAPGHRRRLIGAALVQHVFERAAYGCRLFCCWCAQDIEANRFWESLGFVPLAFRTGGRKRVIGSRPSAISERDTGGTPVPLGRVHIFWQRRIRRGDVTSPYWYPCQTNAGAIREDRLVLPIPPGTHWSDAKPIVLPRGQSSVSGTRNATPTPLLPAGTSAKQGEKVKPAAAAKRPTSIRAGGLRWAPGVPASAAGVPASAGPSPALAPAAKSPPKPVRNDPRHVAAARELRDRYLEAMDAGQWVLPAQGAGKHEIGRLHGTSTARGGLRFEQPPLLTAA